MAQVPILPEFDEDGLPVAWAPPTPRAEPLLPGSDDDDVLVDQPPPPPAEPGDAWLIALCEELRERADLEPFDLAVEPGPNRRGLCTGRVWLVDGVARFVRLSPCPNADRAEIAATLAHEIAHPLTNTGHDRRFKEALVELVSAQWGPEFFRHARPSRPYPEVDRWVVSGIRAAMAGRPPPEPKLCPEGDAARLVTRIRKLQALAAAQPGEPEAVTACARANDLITQYELGSYQVRLDEGIDDQMVDKWVGLRPRCVWQRHLCHSIARFFGVFSLSMARAGRMHFFGRHADVVATAYLVEVTIAAIERGADAHAREWKKHNRGSARSEKVAFCGSATVAFAKKLRALKVDDTEVHFDQARVFAGDEHLKRGLRWGTARRTTVTHNDAGVRHGESLEVVRGLGARRTPRRLE